MGAWYLSRRRHSAGELEEKLKEDGFGPEEIRSALEYLLERGYLDDLALAEAYIRDKSRFHGRGSLLLRMELLRRRIPRDLIDRALREALPRETELENARRMIARWESGSRIYSGEQLMKKLASRGYPPDLCREAVKESRNR